MESKTKKKVNVIPLGLFSLGMATYAVINAGSMELVNVMMLYTGGMCGAFFAVVEQFIRRKYDDLFEGMGLKSKEGIYPRCIDEEKTKRGRKLYFNLPPGLSSYDFDEKKEAIMQHFKVHNVNICFANGRVIVELVENKLEKSYEFELFEKGVLPIIIGRSYKGIEWMDLSKGEPHLGIYGESGSGKSTLLRCIITNLIVIFANVINIHLIDLKNGAEFGIFERCKNIASFSKTKGEAISTLYKISKEIDRRYDLFYTNKCVDVKEYNKKCPKNKVKREVLIIDEFAELSGEKKGISLLESMSARARACGIHLIISTQRPDKDVLTGRIKANIPRIVGLKTMNDTNSRVVIGHIGLEELRGEGHCILRNKGKETECQAYNLTPKKAREHLKDFYGAVKEKKEKVIDVDFLDKV